MNYKIIKNASKGTIKRHTDDKSPLTAIIENTKVKNTIKKYKHHKCLSKHLASKHHTCPRNNLMKPKRVLFMF